jgi:hypothetical protein
LDDWTIGRLDDWTIGRFAGLAMLIWDLNFVFWNSFGIWNLVLGICLLFGAWNLEFFQLRPGIFPEKPDK